MYSLSISTKTNKYNKLTKYSKMLFTNPFISCTHFIQNTLFPCYYMCGLYENKCMTTTYNNLFTYENPLPKWVHLGIYKNPFRNQWVCFQCTHTVHSDDMRNLMLFPLPNHYKTTLKSNSYQYFFLFVF